MILVFGSRLYGKVDELRGIGKATPARAEALLQALGMPQDAIDATLLQIYAQVPAIGFPVVPIRPAPPPLPPPAGTFQVSSRPSRHI
ncbi:MAG: hypothetical protein ACHRHE_20580 [Tepidisphaerales bacterium]